MNIIENKEFGGERPLFATKNLKLENVTIHAGESALKRCRDIEAVNCRFEGKYPFWHVDGFKIDRCLFTPGARAALWYSRNLVMTDTQVDAPKMFREMEHLKLTDVKIPDAQETLWHCSDVMLENVEVSHADYLFMHSADIRINHYRQQGNYSFQYCRNVEIDNADIDSKDAFWGTENVTVRNSRLNGEYLAWHSRGLRLINCHISGTQPLCYCKDLVLENCTFDADADLAFEESEVEATINGPVTSIKNPTSGNIRCASVGEIIIDENVQAPANCKIITEWTQSSRTKTGPTDRLLERIRNGAPLSFGQRLKLTALLSFPAIVAQISAIAMQYIDASMVGSLGAEASAAIGLVSTSTWLFWGVLSACATGFSVQIAHVIGSSDFKRARQIVRQGLVAALTFSVVIALIGMAIAPGLPVWLRADESIHSDASTYFFIFSMFLPAMQVSFLAGAMLRSAGNMKVPSTLNVMMCVIDVVLNFLLIFPTRQLDFAGISFTMPGAGLGVKGAAIATVSAEAIVAAIMLHYLCVRYKPLKILGEKGRFIPTRHTVNQALRIGVPIGLEHIAICGAQILITFIVAPLGVVAIAANAFAVIAESLCYMPGYGISEAATTLSAQCLGAGRMRLMKSFGRITVFSGMIVMGVLGVALYIFSPELMSIMSPVESIRSLGASILRIEAWAEPMFAAAIVAYGFFVGMGRTILPSAMNLGSIWGVRITLAAILVGSMGLTGVWVAMCVELCFRGIIFLILLFTPKAYNNLTPPHHETAI